MTTASTTKPASLTRILIKPTHVIGGDAQLSFAFNHLGPTGNQRDEVTVIRHRSQEGALLMRPMAQLAMVMNLDECIGCHTCSVTCKQAWTNRSGMEYVWFNNVETPPGAGLSAALPGPGDLAGRLGPHATWPPEAQGRRAVPQAAHHFRQPGAAQHPRLLRALDVRLREPHHGSARRDFPVAQPKSLISIEPMRVEWSANWDDNLGGGAEVSDRETAYHVQAVTLGAIAGFATLVGVAILIWRRRTTGPVFMATTHNDKAMYVVCAQPDDDRGHQTRCSGDRGGGARISGDRVAVVPFPVRAPSPTSRR